MDWGVEDSCTGCTRTALAEQECKHSGVQPSMRRRLSGAADTKSLAGCWPQPCLSPRLLVANMAPLPKPCRRALVEEAKGRYELVAEAADGTSVRARLAQVRGRGCRLGGQTGSLSWLTAGRSAALTVL